MRCGEDLLWLYVPQAAAEMVGSSHGRGDMVCHKGPSELVYARLQVNILVGGLLSSVCSNDENTKKVCAVTELLSSFSIRYIKTMTSGNYDRNDPTTQFFMLSSPRAFLAGSSSIHAHNGYNGYWETGNKTLS